MTTTLLTKLNETPLKSPALTRAKSILETGTAEVKHSGFLMSSERFVELYKIRHQNLKRSLHEPFGFEELFEAVVDSTATEVDLYLITGDGMKILVVADSRGSVIGGAGFYSVRVE